jgi:hypothetical protein
MLKRNAKRKQTYKRVYITKQLYIFFTMQTYKVKYVIVVYYNAIKIVKYFKKQHAIIVYCYLQITAIRNSSKVRRNCPNVYEVLSVIFSHGHGHGNCQWTVC